MRHRIITLAAAAAVLSTSASAAELPVARQKARHVAVHRVHRIHAGYAATHFGYYFGDWGARWGGAPSSWYASRFALGGTGWTGGGAFLASSPKGIAAIDCPARRPDVCLAEPIVVAVPATRPFARP